MSEHEKVTTLNEYQQAALRTANQYDGSAPFALLLAVEGLGVAGEAGEVADLIKKHVGHGHIVELEKMKKELGDVLWYVAVLSDRFGYTLDEVAQANVEKLQARYPSGFSSERSINRKEEP